MDGVVFAATGTGAAEAAQAGASFLMLYAFSGVGTCMGMIIALYNLAAVVGFMREKTEEGASVLSKAAWATGCLALVVFPCAWFFGLIAVVLSRVETGRIYQDKSPLASATPARMGSVNGAMAILLFVIYGLGLGLTFAFNG